MQELDNVLEKMRQIYYREDAKKNVLKENLNSKSEELEKNKLKSDLLEKVSILFQKTSKYAREQGKIQIENFTTRSLRYIFKKNYEFKIEISEKRNASNADFFVIENTDEGIIKTDPTLSNGGGIVDIISLALRLAFMENSNIKIDGPLILDEPAKQVSEEYIFDVGDFLLQFSNQMNRQIIMITHNSHLANIGNNKYLVEKENGISKAVKIFDEMML